MIKDFQEWAIIFFSFALYINKLRLLSLMLDAFSLFIDLRLFSFDLLLGCCFSFKFNAWS